MKTNRCSKCGIFSKELQCFPDAPDDLKGPICAVCAKLGQLPWTAGSSSSAVSQGCSAEDILTKAATHLKDRAVTYDQPGGERSMERTVKAFNALYGKDLTVEMGWMFMVLLKSARSSSGGEFKPDTYEDGAAYFALAGEEAGKP